MSIDNNDIDGIPLSFLASTSDDPSNDADGIVFSPISSAMDVLANRHAHSQISTSDSSNPSTSGAVTDLDGIPLIPLLIWMVFL